jgi:hypothetical protein
MRPGKYINQNQTLMRQHLRQLTHLPLTPLPASPQSVAELERASAYGEVAGSSPGSSTLLFFFSLCRKLAWIVGFLSGSLGGVIPYVYHI